MGRLSLGLGATAMGWAYALEAVAVGAMALSFPRHSPLEFLNPVKMARNVRDELLENERQ